MNEFVLDVTLPILAPVISSSSAAGELGIDSLFGRDRSGDLVIAGSHVKGRLLEALKKLETVLDLESGELEDWFGKPSPEATVEGQDNPMRGRLRFGDFTANSSNASAVRHRIAIDSTRGAVKKGHLLSIESPFATGSVVQFKGQIRFFADDEGSQRLLSVIRSGLRWIPALGGQRSAGFGQLTGQLAVLLNKVQRTKLGSSLPGETLEIALELDAPFCVAIRRVSENLFESDSVIPGSAIKGAFAATLNQLAGRPSAAEIDGTLPEPWRVLGEHFSKIRFGHAFPSPKDLPRPKWVPLSLVSTESGQRDIALCQDPGLIKGKAPVFQIDWKEAILSSAREAHGWDDDNLRRQLRVRTAIDPERRRAQDEQLFAYEMVEPFNHQWRSRVTLPPDSVDRLAQPLLKLWEAGLTHLGKTKVGGRVVAVDPWKPTALRAGAAQFVVTLQSPALILESDPVLNQSLVGDGSLEKAYGDYWKNQSGEALELVRFFAAQELAGGGYLMRRFRKGNAWQPFLLTKPGSVFVLKPIDSARAMEHLSAWRLSGLPLAKPYQEDSWRTCPYVPENGFGEIAVLDESDLNAAVLEKL